MHDRSHVVSNTQVHSAGVFVELSNIRPQIVPQNLDIVISVVPLLLVPESKGVADLVDWDPKLKAQKQKCWEVGRYLYFEKGSREDQLKGLT